MFRFTIRELLLVMAVVALGVGWVAERRPLISQNEYLQQQNAVLLDLAEKRRLQAEKAEESQYVATQRMSNVIEQLRRDSEP
jgi:ribosome biogenesis SPOUT family RNA methylase Rps3